MSNAPFLAMRLPALALLVLGAGHTMSAAQSTKLSGAMAPGLRGDVEEAVITPDGTGVVYRADQDTAGQPELYVAPLAGGQSALRLNAPLVAGGRVVSFRLTPDGTRVVYVAEQETLGVWELYSVPIDGSQTTTKLSGTPVAGGGVAIHFAVSPDSTRAAYVADQETDEVFELYSVPVDGSQASVKLNGVLVSGGDVFPTFTSPSISHDSTLAFYLADQDTDGVSELYSVPLGGGASPTRLNGALASGRHVVGYELSPDGSRVVYRADQDTDDLLEIFSVPVTGGVTTKLNDTGSAGVTAFEISPDSSRVVFNNGELFSVPLAGGAVTTLNGAFPPLFSDGVGAFAIASDSSRVAYVADQDFPRMTELYSVPIDGSAGAIKLNGTLPADGDVSYSLTLSPDALRAVYAADQDTSGVYELYSVPLDGSQASIKISGSLVPGGFVTPGFLVSPDSAIVVYRARADSPAIEELYAAPIVGGQAPTKLNGPLVLGRFVWSPFLISPDSSRVVYRADEESDDVLELFSVTVAGQGHAKLNGQLGLTADGGVSQYSIQISPDSEHVTYLADELTDEIQELYSAPIDGTEASRRLNDPLTTGEVFQSLGSTEDGRVVYLVLEGVYALYSASVDGSEPPVRLSSTLQDVGLDFKLTPDEQSVIYNSRAGPGTHGLYVVPIDGSSVPLLLSGPLVTFGNVSIFEPTPDGSRVIYIADQDTDNVVELYSVPVDASQAPVKVNGPLVTGGRVWSFRISHDGTRVVYIAEQDVAGLREAYSAPADGSQVPIRLNGSLAIVGDVLYLEISPDDAYVGMSGFLTTAGAIELFSVPLLGGIDPVRLNTPLASGQFVFAFDFSTDSSRVVYTADQAQGYELFSVPTAGGLPTRLSAPLPVGGDVGSFTISPEGSSVVYLADQETNDVLEIYRVPVVGSALPVKLNAPVATGLGILGYAISPDGARVVYLADHDNPDSFELYGVPLFGGLPVTRLNSPLTFGRIYNYSISPDSARVAYVANQDSPTVLDIYSVFLQPEIGSVNKPSGSFRGGNIVTIHGGGFTPETSVSFDGVPSPNVNLLDDTRLRVEVPRSRNIPWTPPIAGPRRLGRAQIPSRVVDVSVSDGVSTHTLPGGYTYLASSVR